MRAADASGVNVADGENRIFVRVAPQGGPGLPITLDYTQHILSLPWNAVVGLKDGSPASYALVVNQLPQPFTSGPWRVELEDELTAYLLMNLFDPADTHPDTSAAWERFRMESRQRLKRLR
jgi:hypothetical protein